MSAIEIVFFFLENTKNIKRRGGIIMPKTKFQGFIFTLITALIMAYIMIVYNIATNSDIGLVNNTFLIALKEFPLEAIIVFLLAYFIASPIAKKLAFRIVNPKKDNPMFIILSIQSFTVLVMVGLMSIYALFSQNLINSNIICNYIVLYCKNFIMAYPLQIFVVGPIARFIFRFIFKNQLA
jgi:hypothetical protein